MMIFFAGRKRERATSLHCTAPRQLLAANTLSAWRGTIQGALSWLGSIPGRTRPAPQTPAIPCHEGGGGTWPRSTHRFPVFLPPCCFIRIQLPGNQPSKLDFWTCQWYRKKNVFNVFSDVFGFLEGLWPFLAGTGSALMERCLLVSPVTGTVAGPSRSLFAPWYSSAWTWRECSWGGM